MKGYENSGSCLGSASAILLWLLPLVMPLQQSATLSLLWQWREQGSQQKQESNPVHAFVNSIVLVAFPSTPKSALGKMEGKSVIRN